MEYFYAVLLFIGIVFLTTILTGIFKILVPFGYLALGYYIGTESLVMGIGAGFGALVNIGNVSKYIKTHGTMSSAPQISRLASVGLIIAFIIGLFFQETTTKRTVESGNGWIIFIAVAVAIIVIIFFTSKWNSNSLDKWIESVEYYEIIEKYDEDPKWATKLHFKNGNQGWSETKKGSFMAKDPENDLTFVHLTKEGAEKYASRMFENAEQFNA